MSVYTKFAKAFEAEPELRAFWMSMARHEAGHVGALTLIETLLLEGDEDVELREAEALASAAQRAIESLHEEATAGVSRERAFEVALELESSELEDLVLDLTHVLSDPDARMQAEQMLLHDLGDLSLMIEKHCKNDELLARADAMVESRVGREDRAPVIVRKN